MSKVAGCAEEPYQILCSFLVVAGLASEPMVGKGGRKGGFTLKRPEEEGELQRVAAAFRTWLGLEEGEIKCFMEKAMHVVKYIKN